MLDHFFRARHGKSYFQCGDTSERTGFGDVRGLVLILRTDHGNHSGFDKLFKDFCFLH